MVCPTALAAIVGRFLAYRACRIGGAPVGREITLIGCSAKVITALCFASASWSLPFATSYQTYSQLELAMLARVLL